MLPRPCPKPIFCATCFYPGFHLLHDPLQHSELFYDVLQVHVHQVIFPQPLRTLLQNASRFMNP